MRRRFRRFVRRLLRRPEPRTTVRDLFPVMTASRQTIDYYRDHFKADGLH